MTLSNLALVLAAAALHAGWNYLAKASRNTVAFLWWGVTIGALGFGIYLFATTPVSLPREVWPFFILSDLAELGYFVTLVRGYSQGDLSLVYPLSRGSAPIFLPIWTALFLGERLPLGGYFGIALMVAGIYVASLTPRSLPPASNDTHLIESKTEDNASRSQVRNTAILWALASGVFVSIYSLSDKIVVSAMPPLVYNWWVYAGNAVTWAPIVWTASRRAGNLAELRRNWPRVLVGSAMTIGAYVLVLVALTTSSASYVVAGRGTSVIIGALLGWLALGEGFGRVRVVGAVLMVLGLIVITFAQ